MQEEWYRLPDGRYVNIPKDISNDEKINIVKGLADMFPEEIGKPYYQAYDEYLKGQRTLGGTVTQSLLNLGRGLAMTGLAVPEAVAALATPDKDIKIERDLRDIRERIMGSIPEEYREAEIPNIAMGLGQYGGFGLAALAGGFPAAATLGVSTGVSEQARRIADYERLTGDDVDTGKELAGLAGGAAVGLSEVLPITRMGKRLQAAQKAARSRWFGNIAWTAVEEGAQEGLAEVGQSFIADALYDDKALENLGARVLDNARLGGEVGGIATTLAQLYAGYRRRGMLGANFMEAEYAMPRPQWNQEDLEVQDRAGRERAERSDATEGSTRWQQLFNIGVDQKKNEQIKNLFNTWRQEYIAGLNTGATKKKLGIDPELLSPLMDQINRLESERIAATEADQALTEPEKEDVLSRIANVSKSLRDQLNNPDELQNPTSILNKWFNGNWDSIFNRIQGDYLKSLDNIDIGKLASNPNLPDEDFRRIVEDDRIASVSGGQVDEYKSYLGLTGKDETGFSAAVVMRAISLGGKLSTENSQLWSDPTFHLQSQESKQARLELEQRVNDPEIYISNETLLSPQKTAEVVDRLVKNRKTRIDIKASLFNLRAGIKFDQWVAHHNLKDGQIARTGRTAGQPKLQRDKQQIEKDLKLLFGDMSPLKDALVGNPAKNLFNNILDEKNIVGTSEGAWNQLVNKITGLKTLSELTASKPNKARRGQIRAFRAHLMNLPTFRADSGVELFDLTKENMRSGVEVSASDARKGVYPLGWYRQIVRALSVAQEGVRFNPLTFGVGLDLKNKNAGMKRVIQTDMKAGILPQASVFTNQLENIKNDLVANGHAVVSKKELSMPADARTRPPPSLREIFEIDQDQRLTKLAEEKGITVDELKTEIDYDQVAQRKANEELNKKAHIYLQSLQKLIEGVRLEGPNRVMGLLEAEVGSFWDGAKGVLINNNAAQREGALAKFDGPTATIVLSLSNIDPEGTMNLEEFSASAIEEIDHALIRYGYYTQEHLNPLLGYGLKNKVKKKTNPEGFARDDTYMESVERTHGHLLRSGKYTQKDMEEEVMVAVLGDIRAGEVAPVGKMGTAKRFGDKIIKAIRGASNDAELHELADLVRSGRISRFGAGVGRLKPDVTAAARGEGVRNLYFYERTSPELNKEMSNALSNLRKARKKGADQKELRVLEQKVFQVRQKVMGEHKNMYKFLDPPKIADTRRVQNRMRAQRDEADTPMGDVPLVNPHSSDVALDEFYSIQEGNPPFQIPEAVKYKMRKETSLTDIDFEDLGLTPPDPNAEPRPLLYEQVFKALGMNQPHGVEETFGTLDRLRENVADALYRVSEQSREVHENEGYVQVMANEASISILRLRNNAMNAAAGAYYDGPPVFTGDDPYGGTAIFPEDSELPGLEEALLHVVDPMVEEVAIEYGAALRIQSLNNQYSAIGEMVEAITGIEEKEVGLEQLYVIGEGDRRIPTIAGRGEQEGKRVLPKREGTIEILENQIKPLMDEWRELNKKPAGSYGPDVPARMDELKQEMQAIDRKIEYQKDLLYELRAMINAAKAKHATPHFPKGMTLNDANTFIKAVEGHDRGLVRENVPAFWETFRQHNLGNIKFAEDTWIIKPEIAAIWRELSYMPFYRDIGTEKQAALNSVWGPGFRQAKETSPSLEPGQRSKAISVERPLIGSLLPMKDNLASNLIRHSTALYYDGIQNASGLRVVRDAKSLKIFNSGADLDINPEEWEGRVRRREKASDRTIRVLEKGQQVYYEHVDPMLAASVMSLGFNPAKALEEWLGGGAFGELSTKAILGAASGLRESIVRTPSFQSDNFWRDIIQAWALVGGDKDLFIRAVKNVFSRTSVPRARRLGIAMSPDFLSNPDKLGEHQRKEWERIRVPIHKSGVRAPIRAAAAVWSALGRLGNQTEVATRLAIAERILADGGTEAEAQFAGINIMDYGRRGKNPLWNIFTAWNPFMNGRMVGIDSFYRGARGRWDAPSQLGVGLSPDEQAYRRTSAIVVSRLVQMSMVSGLYYFMVHDEPWWKELTESEKMDGMTFPLFTDPLSKRLLGLFMPSPFESGLFGYTIPVSLLRTMFEKDYGFPKLGGEAKRQLDTTLAFHIFPQIYRPFYNALRNWDEFRRDTILPPHFEEDVDPALQYDYRTSNISHAVASIFAKTPVINKTFMASPKKMEYMIRQYLGTMGAYATTMVDAVMRSITGQGVADTPMHFTGSMANLPPFSFLRVLKDLDRGGGYQEWFYELTSVLDGAVASMNEAQDKEDWDRYDRIKYANQNLLKHQARMRAHGSWLANWRKKRDELMSFTNLTSEQEKMRDQTYRDLRRVRVERGKQLYDMITQDDPSYYERLTGRRS
tara:strand:+ start:1886 stop:8935 length:7050 start_codon:yes stop_codon:yes gene_type:complete